MAYVNDTGLPSVTDILKPWVDTRWFTKAACIRGSQVHDKISADLQDNLFFAFNPAHSPYYENYKVFKPRIGPILLCEKRLKHRGQYTGQPDLVFIDLSDGKVTLLDWKTAQAKQKYWPLQLGGYKNLCKEDAGIVVEKMMTVRLRKENVDKTPLIDVYFESNMERFEDLFLSQLKLFKHFARRVRK